MKNVKLNLAVLAALGVISTQAAAAFVTLPTSGSSAYTTCRTTSNFGAQSDGTVPPTTDSLCAVPNGIGTTLLFTGVPETGFAVFAAGTVSSSITYFSDPVGTLNERVWRNSGTGECIYGKQVLLTNTSTTDYNPQAAGTQKLEVNDFAFGGYTGTVSVGYAKAAASYGSVYRAGRTFTSVQMQPNVIGGATIAPGFLALPTTGATLGTEITGVGQTAGATGTPPGPAPGSVAPTTGQQDAPFSTTHNWVDFTTDVTAGVDEDGSTNPSSPNMYIKQACATGATTATSGNFKIRQTGQETQPWIIVTGTSRAPGTSTAP